jgi:hypothetical protein
MRRLPPQLSAFSHKLALEQSLVKLPCINTKAGGIKNRPSAKTRGTPKSLPLENHTKSRRNVQNSLK